jgi:predicted RNA-binding protein with RPS1 domain
MDQKRNKVVFSHKSVLAEERQKRLQEIWGSLHVGDVIDGTVMRFTDYGAFVDIGGIDGLLHISEISWGKLRHPQEVLKIGEKIPVKILSIVREKEKISLGYKQNQPEPWSIIDAKYAAGQIIHGRAVQIKEYGVFVELEPGLDGLVHISEIAFKRVNNISDEISVGQEITAKILEIDKNRKRISLSIKETLDKSIEGGSGKAAKAGAKKETEKTFAEESAAAEDVFAEESAAAEETFAEEAASATEETFAEESAAAAEAVFVEESAAAEEPFAEGSAAAPEEVFAEESAAAPEEVFVEESEAAAEAVFVEESATAPEETFVEEPAAAEETFAEEAASAAEETFAEESEAAFAEVGEGVPAETASDKEPSVV